MTAESTGGYNSEANEIVEAPIKPIKRMMRAFLIGAAMPDILWCYAFCWAVYVLNHRYNRMIENIPEVLWRDLAYELHSGTIFIFGSKVYAIANLEAKKQLQSRSEKIQGITWVLPSRRISYRQMQMDILSAMLAIFL